MKNPNIIKIGMRFDNGEKRAEGRSGGMKVTFIKEKGVFGKI